jgi:hypothetical protein
MTRAKDSHERELLKNARGARSRAFLDGKECGNSACAEVGKIQPATNYYMRGGRLDSYCIMCRRTVSNMWKTVNPSRKKTKAKKTWKLNLGKAPWCADHHMNSKKCGCAMGVHHKSQKHKNKISKAMKGNTNAKGKKNGHGPLSATHRLKISMSMRGIK